MTECAAVIIVLAAAYILNRLLGYRPGDNYDDVEPKGGM